MKRARETLDKDRDARPDSKRTKPDSEQEEEEQEDDEPQDMISDLGRRMPGWTIGLMSMLRPRDICSLMATSRRLSTYFLETNNLYRLGMTASLGGHIRLEFAVQGKSTQHAVDASPPISVMEHIVPNKAFAPGERLVKAIRDFSFQGGTWLALMQAVGASILRGLNMDLPNISMVGMSTLHLVAEHSAHLQKCWFEAFLALNALPCAQGALRFLSTCESLVRDSLADNTIRTSGLVHHLGGMWETSAISAIFRRAGVTPSRVVNHPHHMWFALGSHLNDLPRARHVWHPLALWIARAMACRLAPFDDPLQPQDPSGLSTLARYMKAGLEFKRNHKELDEAVLEWASEDNIRACTNNEVAAHLARSTLSVLHNHMNRDRDITQQSIRALCLVMTRICRHSKLPLRQVLDLDGVYCRMSLASLFVWTQEPDIEHLAPLLDMEDIRRFYEKALELASDINLVGIERASELPSVKFLKMLASHVRRSKASETGLDPELMDRMRESIELTFQCV
ncbi:hypothetical protein [Mollivirus kamchatka]|nr:hypothetical protein [Mollivirus kamchatka]